jgi:ATP-dependent RNA helicase MSS116, mitochondrial
VIQVGAPTDRKDYINRTGKVGRGNRPGESNLILAPFEAGFLDEIKDLGATEHEFGENETDLGGKENYVYQTSLKMLPPGIIEECLYSFMQYCIPKTGKC